MSAPPTDVEISRALNALATTLNDQHPAEFLDARFQEILDGALAHEPKLRVDRTGRAAGRVLAAADGRPLADVALEDGMWVVERCAGARGPDWAVPRPASAEQAEGG